LIDEIIEEKRREEEMQARLEIERKADINCG
jgi:hypothetical protein